MKLLFVRTCQNDVLRLTVDSKRLRRHSVTLDKEDVHQRNEHSSLLQSVALPSSHLVLLPLPPLLPLLIAVLPPASYHVRKVLFHQILNINPEKHTSLNTQLPEQGIIGSDYPKKDI